MVSHARACASSYTLLRQGEDEPTPQLPHKTSMRSVACLTGLGVLAAFYMAVSVRSASSSSSKREVSLFGRYEKLKLTSGAPPSYLPYVATCLLPVSSPSCLFFLTLVLSSAPRQRTTRSRRRYEHSQRSSRRETQRPCRRLQQQRRRRQQQQRRCRPPLLRHRRRRCRRRSQPRSSPPPPPPAPPRAPPWALPRKSLATGETIG